VRRLLQRDVHEPADVGSEMVGRQFRLSQDVTVGGVVHKAGDTVQVSSWDNALGTVSVVALPLARANPTFDVPKKAIRPDEPVVAGVVPYDVGLDSVVKDYERGESKLAGERARKDGPRADEITRLEGLQATRLKHLNMRLIQGTMFNRFDQAIKTWTDHYNTKSGFTGSKAADPDMVKAMIFEESQMGSSGDHLDDPPTHPVRTRFNIGQMIDTSSLIILELIREDEPGLVATYHLQDIEKDLIKAQSELARLKKLSKPDAAQKTRIGELEKLSEQNWEPFMWAYMAPQLRLRLLGPGLDPRAVREAQERLLVAGGGARVQRRGSAGAQVQGRGHRSDGCREGRPEGQEALRRRQHLSSRVLVVRYLGGRPIGDPAAVVGDVPEGELQAPEAHHGGWTPPGRVVLVAGRGVDVDRLAWVFGGRDFEAERVGACNAARQAGTEPIDVVVRQLHAVVHGCAAGQRRAAG
jgi:hypothetical protein